MVDRTDDPKPTVVRRFEVIEGIGRRRRWSAETKAAIVAESLEPGAVVAEVARRHDVRSQQIHDWRRDARSGRLVLPSDAPGVAAVTFAPIVVAPAAASPATTPRAPRASAALTIEADGVVVRVSASADGRLVEAVVRALRARS
jgi:transposase